MKVIAETVEAEGSAWTAVVEVSGVLFRAGYVANKLNVGLAPYKRKPYHPRWAIEYVRKWAEKQVSGLPAEWHKAHKEMYA